MPETLRLLRRRIASRHQEFGFHAVFNCQRLPGFDFAGIASLDPLGILAESVEGGFRCGLGFMGQKIDQRAVGIRLVQVLVKIDPILHAVLFEQLHRVIAKPGVQLGKKSGRCGVGAQFENAAFGDVSSFEHRRVIGRLQEKLFDLGDDFSIRFGFLLHRFPFGIISERLPGSFARGPASVFKEINQLVVRVVDRNPVTNVFHAVLLEQPHGVIAKSRMQIIEPARRRVVNAHFVTKFLTSFLRTATGES